MNKEHYNLWVKLRAEIIKHFHDTENADLFNGNFPEYVAVKIAEAELDESLQTGWYILSIEEMLTLSPTECTNVASQRIYEQIKKAICL